MTTTHPEPVTRGRLGPPPSAPPHPAAEPAPDSGGDPAVLVARAAAVEHRHGVLPLLDLFDEDPDGLLAAVRRGAVRAALGLFTPNARFSVEAAAVDAARDGGQTVLTGRFRYADPHATAVVVPVALPGEVRLALLPDTLGGGRLFGAGRGWAELDGAVFPARALSRPVTWKPDGALSAAYDGCAQRFAPLAAAFSARAIADLRRELARTGAGQDALSTSQYTSHELSRLEIATALAAAACTAPPGTQPLTGPSAAALLLAAVDALHRTLDLADNLSTELGLAAAPTLRDPSSTATVRAFFGGRRMVEGELARRMGLNPPQAGR
ncbi:MULTISPECIES: hypothetical protein [unclassified Streptomyces]|uniref:hypothetical protein n=1 Tax=unclassified Streptomyces TaxID=2593676 RepID=UPI00225A7869|nr:MULTISPECIES: hypothetical protein [unclassified Streptomyces]MCX4409549.1 hypothetical protein [Streptomyces sp. NBC_01764]MCX5191320.1 hypothetical protein [Streptomyces sp. NBC_00268]